MRRRIPYGDVILSAKKLHLFVEQSMVGRQSRKKNKRYFIRIYHAYPIVNGSAGSLIYIFSQWIHLCNSLCAPAGFFRQGKGFTVFQLNRPVSPRRSEGGQIFDSDNQIPR